MPSFPRISIRRARPCDWESLWPLLEAMGKTDSSTGVRQRFESFVASPEHLIAIGTVDAVLAGYAWAQDRGPHLRSGWQTVRLHDLFVAPPHRRIGLGRELFAETRRWAAERGARWMEWQASGDALAFYERLDLRGDPCPDPEHPFFEIDLAQL